MGILSHHERRYANHQIGQRPPMGRAVIAAEMVYLTGQVGPPGEDVTAQTTSALAAVSALLHAAGSGKGREEFTSPPAAEDAFARPGN